VTSLLSIKLAVKYAQLRDVESMRAIARAHQNRNLAEFEKALRDFKDGKSSFLVFSMVYSFSYYIV
jgi:26S proteasome regulatory subunit N6